MSWRPWRCPVLLNFQWIFTISSNLYVTLASKKRWGMGKTDKIGEFSGFFLFKGNREKHLHCSQETNPWYLVSCFGSLKRTTNSIDLPKKKKTCLSEVLETPLLVYLVSFCEWTPKKVELYSYGDGFILAHLGNRPSPTQKMGSMPIPFLVLLHVSQVVKIWQLSLFFSSASNTSPPPCWHPEITGWKLNWQFTTKPPCCNPATERLSDLFLVKFQ